MTGRDFTNYFIPEWESQLSERLEKYHHEDKSYLKKSRDGKVVLMYREIIEIEQVLYRLSHAVDQGHIEKIMTLFHPDATLIVTWEENGRHAGHEEIRKWFENYDRVVRSSMKYLRHRIACPIIDVDGETATAASYLEVEALSNDTGQLIKTVGRYDDKLVRFEAGWRLMKKVISMDNTYAI